MEDFATENSSLSKPAVTVEVIENCMDELRELSKISSASSSQILISMNRLYVSVEAYLADRGLEFSQFGIWKSRHWGYRLLEGLAERIEACKNVGPLVDEALLDYLEDGLLPALRLHG